LKAGYFEFGEYHSNIVGTPQGSVISPILANIYLNELDQTIAKLKAEFDVGNKSKPSTKANTLHVKIARVKKKGDMALVEKLSKEYRLMHYSNFYDPSFKKISYVRYADD
jgi:retron-type reverse transcriptase